MLSVRIEGADAVARDLGRFRSTLRAALPPTMERAVARLVDYVRREKLSGEVLRARRGKLWFSLQPSVTGETSTATAGRGVEGVVRIGPRAERWAGVHEYGGLVRVPGYRRRTGAVHPYSYQARRRAFLGPSLDEQEAAIVADFDAAVSDVIESW